MDEKAIVCGENNPNFEKQCEDCIREMIESHYNHSAIVIWGILNECASETPEGREMYAKQYEQIRGMDSTRPVTSASYYVSLSYAIVILRDISLVLMNTDLP